MCWLGKAWEWIKRNWKYILFPLGIVLGILALISKLRGPGQVVSPLGAQAEKERQKAQAEADKKAKEAEAARQKKVQELEQEHADTLKKLTDDQKKQVEELREDPDKLNSFLLNVGKSIRG